MRRCAAGHRLTALARRWSDEGDALTLLRLAGYPTPGQGADRWNDDELALVKGCRGLTELFVILWFCTPSSFVLLERYLVVCRHLYGFVRQYRPRAGNKTHPMSQVHNGTSGSREYPTGHG